MLSRGNNTRYEDDKEDATPPSDLNDVLHTTVHHPVHQSHCCTSRILTIHVDALPPQTTTPPCHATVDNCSPARMQVTRIRTPSHPPSSLPHVVYMVSSLIVIFVLMICPPMVRSTPITINTTIGTWIAVEYTTQQPSARCQHTMTPYGTGDNSMTLCGNNRRNTID